MDEHRLVDWLISFWSELTGFIADYGLLAVAPIVVLTSAGVPLPLPSDLLVMLMGVQAHEGQHPFWLAWLVLSACSFAGATVLYEFARWIGQGGLEHVTQYGRFIGLSEQRLKDTEGKLRAWGQVAIFVGRVAPFLRMPITVACGVLGIPRRTYLPVMGLAAVVYIGLQLALGYVLGAPVIAALEQIVIPLGVVVPMALVGILLLWVVRVRRSLRERALTPTVSRAKRSQAGALAAALAVGGASMVVNAFIYLGGPLAEALLAGPGSVVALALTFPVELLFLLSSIVLVTLLGVACGAVYGAIDEHLPTAWPDWLHGFAFAALPLMVSLLLLTPLYLFFRGEQPAAWQVAAVGEIIVWALYGVLLGLIYPLFRARSASRPRPVQNATAPEASVGAH